MLRWHKNTYLKKTQAAAENLNMDSDESTNEDLENAGEDRTETVQTVQTEPLVRMSNSNLSFLNAWFDINLTFFKNL